MRMFAVFIANGLAVIGAGSLIGVDTLSAVLLAGSLGVIKVSEALARAYIDEAVSYASAIGCANIHVMAGVTDQSKAADDAFQENLRYAAQIAETLDLTILIEPLNHRDAPSYHLQSVEASAKVISAINSDRIKIMFDFYHIQILQGDVLNRFKAHLPFIGHVQIASVPERAEPDRGELNYVNLISAIYEAGYQGYVGAEYKPIMDTDSGLGWLASY